MGIGFDCPCPASSGEHGGDIARPRDHAIVGGGEFLPVSAGLRLCPPPRLFHGSVQRIGAGDINALPIVAVLGALRS